MSGLGDWWSRWRERRAATARLQTESSHQRLQTRAREKQWQKHRAKSRTSRSTKPYRPKGRR